MRVTLHGLTAAAAQSIDVSRTNIWNLLRQRFYDMALEAPAASSATGWTDLPEAGIIEAVEVILSGWEVSRSDAGCGERAWFATRDSDAAWVTVDSAGAWEAAAAGPSDAAAGELLQRLRQAFPTPTYSEAGVITVRYWAMGAMGPFSYQRRLEVTPWAEGEANYPAELADGEDTSMREQLSELMALEPPDAGGRLLLFTGPPGTGKTHLIRSLADAWRSWCDIDYIVDADQFFGLAAYMVEALVVGPDNDRWRLVVIEDAGEFLIPDANKRAGQGLSRLLNLSDGLVGQGLKLLILMTTNEEAEQLYPAVTRAGRCLSHVEFHGFTGDEADAWRAAHGKPATGAPASLASLFNS